VILLDHRVTEQVSTRRLRIVKYRGTLHGTNEYPFLIGKHGISVLPITSLGLEHQVSTERISTGVKELDEMMGNNGFYRGSSILVSGKAGTGKTTLASAFVDATCKRGERCLYFAFEESTAQILRNMRSVGIDLAPHVKRELLQFRVARPSQYGLEMHLVTMYDLIREFKPSVVILDPITDFATVGNTTEVKAVVTRMIDFLKSNQMTGLFVSVISGAEIADQSVVGVSSLIDAWISLRNLESNGERQRGLYVLKSRGMSHSNEIRSFQLTDNGIKIGAMNLARRLSEFSSS
jgi:circadian clock protein KaiC